MSSFFNKGIVRVLAVAFSLTLVFSAVSFSEVRAQVSESSSKSTKSSTAKKNKAKKSSQKKLPTKPSAMDRQYYDITRSPKYASLVMDEATGKILFEQHADDARYPASLTKMMTLYLTFEALQHGSLQMPQRLPVSDHAANQAPSKLYLRPGEAIAVRDAIMALIIKSANDVAVVMAEGIAGSESRFAERMTETAHRLGMKDTFFQNASGLHNAQQRTTAHDLAVLAIALRRDYPQFYPLFSRTGFNYRGQYFTTHNRVVTQYSGAEGLKTGFTQPSGFNLVTTAKRNGTRLVAVVLGGQTARARDQHMMRLLDRAFQKLSLSSNLPESGNAFIQSSSALNSTRPSPQLKPIDALLINQPSGSRSMDEGDQYLDDGDEQN